ncbi:hypothetical protein LSH36_241g07018 [Paralvinella palmiformis]|uniref:Immunoglobulin-binding protein 1 n=1 Tax=Paralvinella palmiformis TaxID=53620 RepID=A0AAD9JMG6_9ANNE|nr:hypothetical protein LSH36_241g07018 [Paralvinella palmiformis]
MQDDIRKCVKQGIEAAEKAVIMVNQLRLFSDNEELEEVSTSEIKYMLLPAILGYLEGKKTEADRLETINKSKVFYVDFLRICKNYGVAAIETPFLLDEDDTEDRDDGKSSSANARPSQPNLQSLNAKRQQRIERYKQQKENERQLKELKSLLEKEHVDEEVKRGYYTTLLKKWVTTSLEELESIQEEVSILEQMSKMRGLRMTPTEPTTKPTSAFRPFILTKSTLQKKVYGAGYPSLPTYTIEEYYDQQVALGNLPAPGSAPANQHLSPEDEAALREQEDIEKEKKVEDDEEETLQKARNWDDWKDDHRRGYGNTKNKG